MESVFNFFNKKSVLNSLCDHFSINKSTFEYTMASFDYVHESPIEFVKRCGIDLLSGTDECKIVFKHITTTNDNLASIMTLGMLTLDKVLSEDTPLNRFLHAYNIEIVANQRIMMIKDKTIYINGIDEPCKPCVRGMAIDRIERDNYTCCKLNKEMAYLNLKLYHDKSEVEGFLSGDDSALLSYTSVINAPEILHTIGKIVASIYKVESDYFLQEKWSKQSGMKRYILDIVVPLNALDNNIDHLYKSDYLDDAEWYDYAGFDYDECIERRVPLEFYRNKKLIEVGLNVLFGSYDSTYCQILPDYYISPNSIRVYKEYSIR